MNYDNSDVTENWSGTLSFERQGADCVGRATNASGDTIALSVEFTNRIFERHFGIGDVMVDKLRGL